MPTDAIDQQPKKSIGKRCCRFFERLITLSIVSCVIIGYLYANTQIRQMQREQQIQEEKLNKFSQIVTAQNEVIQRFNQSVTNSDLLKEVQQLETELGDTESNMQARLQDTRNYIMGQLNATMDELNTIVENAQSAIQIEVEKVQTDVEHYVRTTQDQFSMENSFMIWQLAGTMTIIGGLISMWHMTDHLRNFNQPFVQRKILAILWMCPIYSVTSWLSLVFVQLEGYLGIIKDLYEAYVIYQFLSFCIAVLGRGDREAVVRLLAQHADHLSPPYRLFGMCRKPHVYDSDFAKADAVLLQCQLFAMQFVFLKPLCAIAMFTCDKMEWYGGGGSRSSFRAPQNYISILTNISVFLAFSGLLKFYHAVQDELSWCRPFPKFLTIKGVVFMTFWQGMAIAILARTSNDFDPNSKEASEWAAQAQCFLICLEMLCFSIAHFYCFPTIEWTDGYRPVDSNSKVGDKFALNDFVADIKLVLGPKKRKKSVKECRSSDSASDEAGESDEVGESNEDTEEKDEKFREAEKRLGWLSKMLSVKGIAEELEKCSGDEEEKDEEDAEYCTETTGLLDTSHRKESAYDTDKKD